MNYFTYFIQSVLGILILIFAVFGAFYFWGNFENVHSSVKIINQAEDWYNENLKKIPKRDSEEWEKMIEDYKKWVKNINKQK